MIPMTENGHVGQGETASRKSRHLYIIGMQCVYIVFLTWLTGSSSDEPHVWGGSNLEWLIFFCITVQLVFVPVSIANVLGIILYNPFDRPVRTNAIPHTPFICFRTVTKGIYPRLVMRNVLRNKKTCLSTGLRNFEIEALTDNVLNIPKEKHVRETVVPDGYKTPNNTLYKARALNYCLEPSVNHLGHDDWVVHLDEESLLTEESIVGICEFINNKHADVGQGAINCAFSVGDVVPNWFITLADCFRLGMDYGWFRFQFDFLRAPWFGFKGSYIVLKNGTERDVGFDLGPEGSITEDCYFALKAWAKGYTYGFVKGVIKEQSPFSMMDFIKQRKRWFMGHVYICFAQDLSLFSRLGDILDVLCCVLMPVSLATGFMSAFVPFDKPTYQIIMLGFSGGSFAFSSFIGTYMSFVDRQWPAWKLILTSIFNSLVFFPAGLILHSVAVLWGLATLNTAEFHIVQKETNGLGEKKQ